MGFFSSLNERYDIILCVYWFELFSQVSNVAHGPLVLGFFFYLHKFSWKICMGVEGCNFLKRVCKWLTNRHASGTCIKTPVVYRMSRIGVFQILQGVNSSRASSPKPAQGCIHRNYSLSLIHTEQKTIRKEASFIAQYSSPISEVIT